jgi:hypothetical protein
VHGEVAAVAEDDRVHVLALGVVADRARRVVRGQRAVRLRQALRLFHSHQYWCDWGEGAAYELEHLLLEPVHDDLEELAADGVELLCLALDIYEPQPLLVCRGP